MIALNDYAVGDLFGGTAAFMAKLGELGFVKVRNLHTPGELEDANLQIAKTPGNWSGPWLTEYPWESNLK